MQINNKLLIYKMGCGNSDLDTKDFDKISRAYNSLIKSVEDEMKGYQKKLKDINYDENKEKEINKEYDQKILNIFLDENNYYDKSTLGYYLKNNSIDNARECMENEYLMEKINNSSIILIRKLDLERKHNLEQLKNANNNADFELVTELKKKIELCKNQIKTYEKEKQAAIIGKREEIRNKLIMNNMENGVFSQYNDRQNFNKIVDKKIVNQIHNDYGNSSNNDEVNKDNGENNVEYLIVEGPKSS